MKQIEWKNLNTLDAFKKLKTFKNAVSVKHSLAGKNGAKRVEKYSVPMAAGLTYNYAAKQVNMEILDTLASLAKQAQLTEKFALLYNGEIINTGEGRMVLHHLVRGQLGGSVMQQDANGEKTNKREFYLSQQKAIADFVADVHSGKIKNEKGEKYTTVCQIGIGGSDLGPRAIYIALENWARATGNFKMDAHFISNVDPDDAAAVVASLDISRTIFVLVSKSGTTLETLTNESFVTKFIKDAGCTTAKHIVAVTSATSPLANNPAYMASFYMDDFIGGRYSSTSAVGGVILSLAFGAATFEKFLKGAHAADKTATEKDITKNAAMLDALIGVYERNVQGYPTTAVLPYSQGLARFPAHLQQLDMESNGKSVNRFGKKINYSTGAIIFGEPGTNGQHSFYQLLHQGTDIVPLQFIAFSDSQCGKDITVKGSTSQKKLLANVVAQIIAFACGKDDKNPNKYFAGDRPSSLIYGKKLTPETIGALLAHYENKVMFQGFLWNVNSFDQEGVQLGKKLATSVLENKMEESLSAFAKLVM